MELLLLSLILPVALSASTDLRYPPPSVRKAPNGYNGHNFTEWTAPPVSHLTGVYHITHTSSQERYSRLTIQQYPVDSSNQECASAADTYDCPEGSMSSVSSWSTCEGGLAAACKDSSPAVSGWEIPIGALGPTDRKYVGAWRYTSEYWGRLHAAMAWGTDDVGTEWLVEYGTRSDARAGQGGEGAINILSRSESGPSTGCLNDLVSEMQDLCRELGDEDLLGMVQGLHKIN